MLSLKLLDEHIEECKLRIANGTESEDTLALLLKLREHFEVANESDWNAYNEIVKHMPNDDDADPLLIVLKGQLLIERLVRRFIDSRLLNPKALEKQQFTAAQYISLAESMCLDNEEPRWLWAQIRELNNIRNKLAHNLENENTFMRIENFVSTVSNAQSLEDRNIASVIARLYGMVKGVCDLSESDEFSLKRKL